MTYDKVKLLKQDNKQLGRKAVRLLQLNLRFCILLSLLLITIVVITHLNRTLEHQPKHLSLHQYVRNFFNDPYLIPLKKGPAQNDSDYDADEFDEIWSEETIELFQDQLGIIIGDENNSSTCHIGEEFFISALPGADDEHLGDNLWQYLSLIALESMQNVNSEKLILKAYVTEQMRAVLEMLFEGILLEAISVLPPSCYDLKYAKIIGNKSPINLKEIAPATAPLLLDPKAKRVKEIAQLFGSKMRPFLRFRQDIMKEVLQEFLVTKTIQEVEAEREMDVNYVGVFITTEDKLPTDYYQKSMNFHRKNEPTIFLIVCDAETYIFCQETFNGKDAVGDTRILRKSVEMFDFALMSSCNSTIVSNDMGVLHALVNGGDTTVYRPEETAEPEYYIPFLISEQMANFYAIE